MQPSPSTPEQPGGDTPATTGRPVFAPSVPDRVARLLDQAVARGVAVVVQVPVSFGAAAMVAAWADARGRTERLTTVTTPAELLAHDFSGFTLVRWPEAVLPDLPSHVVVLAPSHLVLSLAEVEALLPSELSSLAPRILAQTAGWPWLVHAAVTWACAGAVDQDAETLVPCHALDRVRRQAATWIPEAWRATLQLISIAGGLHPDELRGGGLVDASIVRAAIERGLLAWSPGASRVLRLAPPAELALAELVAPDDAVRRTFLREVAGDRSRSGLFDGGLAAAAALEDWELCATILDRWCIDLMYSPHRELADATLRRVPPLLLRRSPRLALRAEGLGLLPVGTTVVPRLRGPSDVQDVLARDGGREVLDRTFLAMGAYRRNGDPLEAARIAARTAELTLGSARSAGTGRELAGLWFVHAGLSAQQSGDKSSARAYYRTAIGMATYDGFGIAADDARAKLAALSVVRGETRTAQALLGELPAPGTTPLLPTIATAARIARHGMAVDALAPVDAATEVALLGDPFLQDEMWPVAHWVAVRHLIGSGRAVDALALTDEVRRLQPLARRSNGDAPRLLALLSAEAHLRLGHGTQAMSALGALPRTDPRAAVVRARVLLLTRDDDAAHAEAMMAAGSATASPRTRREAALVAATVEMLQGRADRARDHVDEVIKATSTEGDQWTWSIIPDEWRAQLGALTGHATPIAPPASPPPADITLVSLTARERVVLEALARGLDQSAIARELVVSVNTVKTQLRGLYRKLDVNRRTEAVAKASALGLLQTRSPLDRAG